MLRPKLLVVLALVCLSALSFGEKSKVVLGKLGQVTKASRIYAGPSTRGRVYYRLKPYEYLVVRDTGISKWLLVLLQNGTYGYVNRDAVAKLPYEAVQDQANRPTSLAGSRGASLVANYSLNFIGTPYKWGGNDELRGIDCSGFVKNMYGTIGVPLPRTAAEQVRVGLPIKRLEDLAKGDRLYFWDKKRNKVGHTGIYLGNGYFVHSSSGKGVATDYLGDQRWLKILVAARR